MGLYFADQYSLLHLAVGIVMYYWNISFFNAFLIHFLFELGENTKIGMKLINNYFTQSLLHWPGGKPKADSVINIMGDNIFFMIGWLVAYGLDQLGNSYGWYPLHIK